MRRRTFCASALGSIVALTAPLGRAHANSAHALHGVDAISRLGKAVSLTTAEVDELRQAIRGSLLLRTSAEYDSARRIWNGAFDKHPALIARCAGAADVLQCVQFARAHDLLLAVRGGGHSLPGHSTCDGGLVIDLSPMRSVRIDPTHRRALVEPGVLLGELDREAQAFGLVTPAGTVSHTGVAGLTLGGGTGRLARRFGLSCDNLRSVDIVTADGRFLSASDDENADLFWAVRGGGGNFGVVTSFEFRLHPLGRPVIGGDLVYRPEAARDVLAFMAEYGPQASDELWLNPMIGRDADGALKVVINVCHSGEHTAAERELRKLRAFGRPLADKLVQLPYAKLQSSEDDLSPHGLGYYASGGFLTRLDTDIAAICIERLRSPDGGHAKFEFTQLGGAIARVRPTATAYTNREAVISLLVRATWDGPEGAQTNLKWGRESWKLLRPFTRGFYANLSQESERLRLESTYGENLPRLVELKTKYDPLNLFRLNPNIEPRGSA
jgi:FAD/FMN-containing dehydrogenase